MAYQNNAETVTGTVEAVNRTGFKINGSWVNYSKYYKGQPVQTGQNVSVEKDGNFANNVIVIGSARQGGTAVEAPSSPVSGSSYNNDRNLSIQRQVALKAAVDTAGLISSGSGKTAKIEVTVEGIIEVARQFEAYLAEPFAATDEPEALPY